MSLAHIVTVFSIRGENIGLSSLSYCSLPSPQLISNCCRSNILVCSPFMIVFQKKEKVEVTGMKGTKARTFQQRWQNQGK